MAKTPKGSMPMSVETKFFALLAVPFAAFTLIYGFWTKWAEPIGVVALALTAGLCILTGFFLWMTGRKLPDRPEDNLAGNIEEAEGDYGYFVASSWTPLWLGGSSAILFLGLAVGWWLFILGLFLVLIAVCLWVFESFTGEYSI